MHKTKDIRRRINEYEFERIVAEVLAQGVPWDRGLLQHT